MTTLTVTSKGQVTLKRDVLRHLSVAQGEKVVLDLLPDGTVSVRAVKAGGTIDGFIGCLAGKNGLSLSLDEIDEVIRRGWAGER